MEGSVLAGFLLVAGLVLFVVAAVRSSARPAGYTSVGAGVLWIVAWLHLLAAHGVTPVNERRLVLGLTWLDSGRLVAPSLVLVAASIWLLVRRRAPRSVRLAAAAAVAGTSVAAAGAVLGFWTQPFGTYVGASREAGLAAIGGGIAVLGSVAMAAGLLAFAVASARHNLLPGWLALVVGVAALTAVPWLYEATAQGWVFGLVWVIVGVTILRRGARSADGEVRAS